MRNGDRCPRKKIHLILETDDKLAQSGPKSAGQVCHPFMRVALSTALSKQAITIMKA